MTQLVGKIDGFNGRGVFGWVRRRDEESSLHIDIWLDGVRVATSIPADRFRKDLAGADRSHGRHGFAWELPLTATFGDRVKVKLTSSDSGETISEREFLAPFGDSAWRGSIREPKNQSIAGWIKLNGSNQPVIADFYIDEHLVRAAVGCDIVVSELHESSGSEASWGFNVAVDGFIPRSEKAMVSLRDPADGTVMLSREVATSALKDSYRGNLELSGDAVIRGWAINENNPGAVFDVELLVDGHPFLTAKNTLPRVDLREAGLSLGKGGVRFVNPMHEWLADGAEHTLSLRFPDQTATAERRFTSEVVSDRGRVTHVLNPRPRGVTVIVPIYNAPDDVEICIERLLTHTFESAQILLIDDCSPDPQISEILSRYQGHPRVRILSNSENLGFTRTVNRGISEAGDNDVLLLNSDARVTPGWLNGMLLAASSSLRIATVTAMSDRAGAFSAPTSGNDNPLPSGVDEITYARAFRRRSVGVYPRVPTGNGFCMWISRECLNEVGGLDEQAFPRGYGEENDFCMRAGRAGWIHVIDDRTYVFHDRSKSFGDSKADLLAAGRAIVDARYPEYKQATRVFRESPAIALARNRASMASSDVMLDQAPTARVLYVISTTTGGTPQTNADLMDALGEAVDPWVLRCDSREITLSRVIDGKLHDVCTYELRSALEPIGHFSPEYDGVVASWLTRYDFDVVHIRHLLWHSLSLPNIAKTIGARVIVSFHDYYALSPNLKLIDDQGAYLGDEFRAAGSVFRDSGWDVSAYPLPTGEWLQWWQDRFWRSIRTADAFITTSESARKLILSHFSEMDPARFHVIEHGRDFEEFRSVAARPSYDSPLRILVPGGINAAKGAEILRSMADSDLDRQIEWHILGPIKESFESVGSSVVYHGAYKRENFGRLVEKIAPHAGVVLSIWDETYCHTITEMWSVGLPVFVLDFPNVAERVRRFKAGWILDGDAGPSLATQIVETLYDREQRLRALRGVSDWQTGWGIAWTRKQMAMRYLGVYRGALAGTEPGVADSLRVGVLASASRHLSRGPKSTFTRFWERTSNAADRKVDYLRVTLDGALAAAQQGLLDALLVQPAAVPPAATAELVRTLKAARIALILDVDEDPETGHSGETGHSPAHLTALVSCATAISVPTVALRERLAPAAGPIEVFRDALSDRLWSTPARPRVPDGKIRAVCMGHRAHGRFFETILQAFDRVAAAQPEFEFVIIGAESEPESDHLHQGRPWLTHVVVPANAAQYPRYVEWLREYSAAADFAVVPLAGSQEGSTASDLEVLEYLALGLRVMVSDGSSHREHSIPGVTVVPGSDEDWTSAVRRMTSRVVAEGPRIDMLDWIRENRVLSGQRARFDAFVESAVSAVGTEETSMTA
ncbi:glycosyltransferase [Microbacterium sp. GXF0217]